MTDAATIDQADFRRAMGHFATGIAIVSTREGDCRSYGTISSFASLSLDPPFVQWSIKHDSFGYPIFRTAEMFAVNNLAADQEQVSRDFYRPIDRSTALPQWTGKAASTGCRWSTAVSAGSNAPASVS